MSSLVRAMSCAGRERLAGCHELTDLLDPRPAALVRALVLTAGVGSALVGGVFFAFSAFVLPALGRLPGDGAAAMRSINVLAVRPPLMVALFGTAAVCAVAGVLALRRGEGWVAAGSATYLLGVVLVTVVANVPLNERLAGHRLGFGDYARAWGRWNHVRTVAGTTAAVLLLWSLTGR